MRVVFVGCVDFSYSLLEKVITLPDADVVGVVTRDSSTFNADFCSLLPLAQSAHVPCFIDSGNQQAQMADWMRGLAPDIVYCFGWSYLLRKEILQIPRLGVLGYHPTPLPRNRGRHPIIWTLTLGLNETASTFFFMDEGADSGDLLSQRRLEVSHDDAAASLYARLKELALEQIEAFTPLLASGDYERMPQVHANANYWRKRIKADGKIDWRMPAAGIYNLVRALTRPYVGAHFEHQGGEIKVWRCEVVTNEWPLERISNLEPGHVLGASVWGVDIRCGDGAVRLTEHELKVLPETGSYL